MRFSPLLFCGCVLTFVFAGAASLPGDSVFNIYDHLFPVEREDLSVIDDFTMEAIDSEASAVLVNFGLQGERFSARMVRNRNLIAENYHVRVYGENDELLKVQARSSADFYAFEGEGTNATRQRLFVLNHDLKAPQVRGYVYLQNGEHFNLEPQQEHVMRLSRTARSKTGVIVAYPTNKISYENENCGGEVFPGEKTTKEERWDWDQDLPAISDPARTPAAAPCTQTIKKIGLGTVIDHFLTDGRFGGSASDAENEILALINYMSGVYQATMSIVFESTQIIVYTAPGNQGAGYNNVGFNPATCAEIGGINEHLDCFSWWRGLGENTAVTEDRASDLFQLLTYCYRPVPGGGAVTVGLAWTGTVCETTARPNGGSGQYYSATSVSSYNPSSGYLTVMHELGHTFGAPHDFDNSGTGHDGMGIMSYDGNSNQFSRTSQVSMCAKYGGRVNGWAGCAVDADVSCSGCAGKECGYDSCNTLCGSCTAEQTCADNNRCVAACVPNCSGKDCGDDGCGGSCGGCGSNEICTGAACVSDAEDDRILMMEKINNARQAYGGSAISWNSELENCLNLKKCGAVGESPNYSGCGSPSTGTLRIGGTPAHPLITMADYIIDNGRPYYCCASDTAANSWAASNFRNWMSQQHSDMSIACVVDDGCTSGRVNVYCSALPEFSSRDPAVSNRGNCPDCNPATCQSRVCGSLYDGCGCFENCGSCSIGDCDEDAGQCTNCPAPSCDNLGTNSPCGTYTDACGQSIDCGGCDGNCENNHCECVPRTEEELRGDCNGAVCGTVSNGCGGEFECGRCLGTFDCTSGQCVFDCGTCPEFSTCDVANAQCTCLDGYELNQGSGRCDEIRSDIRCATNQYVIHQNHLWNPAPASDSFEFDAETCALVYSGNAVSGCGLVTCDYLIEYQGYTLSNPGDTVSASITLNSGAQRAGVFLQGSFDDSTGSSTYVYIFYDVAAQQLKHTMFSIYERSPGSYSYRYADNANQVIPFSWAVGSTKIIQLERTSTNCAYSYSIANADGSGRVSKYTRWYCDSSSPFMQSGTFGLVVNGPATFEQVTVGSTVQMTFNIYGCLSQSQARSVIAQLLGISESQILDVSINCGGGSRRQVGAAVVPVAVTLYSDTVTAAALSSLFATQVANNLVPFGVQGAPGSVVSVSPASPTTIPPNAPVVEVPPAQTIGGGGSGGLSGGQIAGIVIGSTAAVGLALGAGMLLAKGSGGGSGGGFESGAADRGAPEIDDGEGEGKKRDGIPVMNAESHVRRVEAGEHQSVSARNVAK